MIKNNVNGRVYIGSSCCIDRRLYNHFSKLKRASHVNTSLQEDYSIFGEDNFIASVLCEVDESVDSEELYDIEQFYLDNFVDFDQDYNVAKKATGAVVGEVAKSVTVSVYNKYGEFAGTFPSISKANQYFGIKGNFKSALAKESNTANGYYVRRGERDYDFKIPVRNGVLFSCYDMDGCKVQTFNKYTDGVDFVDCYGTSNSIRCNVERCSMTVLYGYYWVRGDEPKIDLPKPEPVEIKPPVLYHQYNRLGEYIRTHEGLEAVRDFLGIKKPSCVSLFENGWNLISHGYYWSKIKVNNLSELGYQATVYEAYDDSGKVCHRFARPKDAADFFGKKRIRIKNAIKLQNKASGYNWRLVKI